MFSECKINNVMNNQLSSYSDLVLRIGCQVLKILTSMIKHELELIKVRLKLKRNKQRPTCGHKTNHLTNIKSKINILKIQKTKVMYTYPTWELGFRSESKYYSWMRTSIV